MYTSKKIFFFFALFTLHSLSVLSQKTDKILLDNDDWITGEIKKMDYGKLSLKTSAAGTISIKWDRIYKIKSDKYFEIRMGRGVIYYGSFDITKDDEKYKLLLIAEEEEIVVDMNLIVEITPIKNRFWGKIDGRVDVGYSYTKGSDVKQFNSSFSIEYRPDHSIATFSGSSIFTEQPERDPTSKQDANFSYRYIMKNNLAYTGFSSLQQNSELGIILRTSLGVGMSKNWIRSNMQRFITTMGVIINREKGSDESGTNTNYEGLLRAEYKVFRYRDPEIDITTYIDFYPSFTIKDRYRTDLDIKVKFEVFNNFYIGFSFYYNLDTKPPDPNASKSDWGINSSLGYSF